jgi:hypothetical protein
MIEKSNSTSLTLATIAILGQPPRVGTKTDTPLIETPQSISIFRADWADPDFSHGISCGYAECDGYLYLVEKTYSPDQTISTHNE